MVRRSNLSLHFSTINQKKNKKKYLTYTQIYNTIYNVEGNNDTTNNTQNKQTDQGGSKITWEKLSQN